MKAWSLLIAVLLSGQVMAQASLFNEQGYRSELYRRATPETPPAGQRLNVNQLRSLIRDSNPVLIDVQAVTLRPESEDFGLTWLPSKTRWHISGSTWLPNVGYGELDAKMMHYFASNLERLTGEDFNRAIVFYCVVDCWMSWNAVKRAHEMGYRNLYWYAEGTDGWQQAGYELVRAEPHPLNPLSPPAFFLETAKPDISALLQQARSSDRDILIFFETRHCPFCQRMHKSVLIDADLIKARKQNFLAISIDLESDQIMRTADGEESTQAEFSRQFRVVKTPTLLFFDADFDPLHKHSGLVATAGEMKRLLSFVSSREYERQSWRQYKRSR